MAADGSTSPEPVTHEEAKRIIRRLELDAYSAVVTAFRAQGDLNKGKKSMLGDLCSQLSISTERHRAEVRRVVNDDRLNAVAGCMNGPGTSTEWAIEGRRLVSLMPRLVPQTVFTAKASAAANLAVEKNKQLPIKTEIELHPMPQKIKSQSTKFDRTQDYKEKALQKFHLTTDNIPLSKIDDKMKKKKANILLAKTTALTLSKTLNIPLRSTAPSTLRPMIKTPLKCSIATITGTKSLTTLATSSMKFTNKSVLLQHSPTKTQFSLPKSTNSGNTVLPLSTVNSLPNSKTESFFINNSPTIKVVSNTATSNSNSIIISSSTLQNNIITQKIKFKTPLPKSKVKATKFKPMVPLQRTSLTSNVSNDQTKINIASAGITTSKITSQNQNVKVVQVAKSGSISSSLALLNSVNRPIVVVSSSTLKPTTPNVKSLSTSSVTTTTTSGPQQIKANLSQPSSLPSSKPNLVSKTVPLATGFKMIAVTTLAPGSTQVKTVYIATPIMSMTKTLSQSNTSSVPTSSNPSAKILSSNLNSTLQSLVARSLNTENLNSVNKSTSMQTLLSKGYFDQTTAISISKNTKISLFKGLSNLKTSGMQQNLKVLTGTATSKTSNDKMKMNSSVTSTNMLPSIINQNLQRIGNGPTNTINNNLKQNSISTNPSTTTTFLNLKANSIFSGVVKDKSIVSLQKSRENIPGSSKSLENDKVNSITLPLNESIISTEQITASATGETDDMAFLSAGEKFLEQLSAKIKLPQPSNAVNEVSELPSSTSSDISHSKNSFQVSEAVKTTAIKLENRTKIHILNDTPINLKNHLPTAEGKSESSVIKQKSLFSMSTGPQSPLAKLISPNSSVIATSSSLLSSIVSNSSVASMTSISSNLSTTFNLKPNTLNTNDTEKIKFPNNYDDRNPKQGFDKGLKLTTENPINFSRSPKVINITRNSNDTTNIPEQLNKTIQASFCSVPSNNTSPNSQNRIHVTPEFLRTKNQISTQKIDSNQTKNTIRKQLCQSFSKIQTSNKTDINSLNTQPTSNKIISLSPQNKLQLSLPGSSKLNISPLLVNHSKQLKCDGSEAYTQICTPKTIINSTGIFTSPAVSTISVNLNGTNLNSAHQTASSSSTKQQESNSTSSNCTNNNVLRNSNINASISNNSVSINKDNPKKRKLNNSDHNEFLGMISPRTQASWIRGAANLLQRVSRFRGTNKQKGEMNAASWFTKPVDPNEEPGYYRVIKTPMDFGKIRKKLEEGEYVSYPNFYEDMMTIKSNCLLYNPAGHIIRKDCEDVFAFFESEYKKLLERWEKHHVSPHKKIKLSSEAGSSR